MGLGGNPSVDEHNRTNTKLTAQNT